MNEQRSTEHFVSRAFYPGRKLPNEPNLTLPAHQACNATTIKDEEWVATSLSMSNLLGGRRQEQWDRAMRSIGPGNGPRSPKSLASISSRGRSGCFRSATGDAPPGMGQALDPFTLDWGSITPDTLSKDNVAIHVVAHELGTPAGIERTLRFVNARVTLFARHLPAAMKQAVIVDDRGQALSRQARERLRAGLASELAFVQFFSERI